MTSLVRTLMAELQSLGLPSSFDTTGGGCMAVVIYRNDDPDLYRILVTDREDVFSRSDLDSDDDVWGFYVSVYDTEGEVEVEDGIYLSPEPEVDDDECPLVDAGEPGRCALAIAEYVRTHGR